MTDLEFQLVELKHKITEANHAYYNLDDPVLTDSQYDELLKELIRLETEHPELLTKSSPSQNVGGDTSESLSRVNHDFKMYSLDNIYNQNDLKQYEKYLNNKGILTEELEWYCDLKMDGMSLACTYKDEYFTQAATRGNGITGEDITTTVVKSISNLPSKFDSLSLLSNFPKYLQVRGECIIYIDDFAKKNQELISIGEKALANPRNMVAGLLRRLPSNLSDIQQCIKYYIYGTALDTCNTINIGWTTHQEMIADLSNMGFDVVPNGTIVSGLSGVCEYYEEILKVRNTIPFPIDGIVFRLNDFNWHNKVGYTNKSPNFARAYKFPAERGKSKIKNIVWNVGRTGVITPVAILDPPIPCNGVVINRATLHNEKLIHDKDIRIGDTVTVERSGDVIPKIIEIFYNERNNDSVIYPKVDYCPCCNNKTKYNDTDAYTYCTNKYCKEKLQAQFKYIVGKTCLDITGFGKSMICDLRELGYLNHVLDIFTITNKELTYIRINKSRADRLFNLILNKKNKLPLATFICLLNIPHIGKTAANTIADNITTIDKFLNVTLEQLLSIDDIGSITAQSIITYLKENQDLKTKLSMYGINVIPTYVLPNTLTCSITGNKVLLTGTFTKFNLSRTEMYTLLSDYGIIPETVFSKLDYLIIGFNPSEQKIDKAHRMNTNILTEEELFEIINTSK